MTDTKIAALTLTRKGQYRHCKGLRYELIATARHSETLGPMTLCRALYDGPGLWVRPATMFNPVSSVPGIVFQFLQNGVWLWIGGQTLDCR